mgnify:CR=1 FL=1
MHTLDRVLLGTRIRKRREELLISKKDFAEMLGITPKFLDDVESGARGVSLRNLMFISQILKISTDYLLFGNGQTVSDQVFAHIIENCPTAKREALAVILQKIIDSYVD